MNWGWCYGPTVVNIEYGPQQTQSGGHQHRPSTKLTKIHCDNKRREEVDKAAQGSEQSRSGGRQFRPKTTTNTKRRLSASTLGNNKCRIRPISDWMLFLHILNYVCYLSYPCVCCKSSQFVCLYFLIWLWGWDEGFDCISSSSLSFFLPSIHYLKLNSVI